LCFYPPIWLFVFSWIDIGETIEESKELMTFSSDKDLNDKEDNVVLLKMIDEDEKVEEPKESMTFIH